MAISLLSATLAPVAALAGTESGFYVGGSIGQASVGDITIDEPNVPEIDFNGDDFGFKIFGGTTSA